MLHKHQLQASCIDSELRFNKGIKEDGSKITRSCKWVKRADTDTRCSIPGVSTHCPDTCGTCDTCVDATLKFKFVWKGKKKSKKCRFFRRNDRCSLVVGAADTCRFTCDKCSDTGKNPTSAPTKLATSARTGATCTRNSNCVSNFCDPTTKVCYASAKCKAVKHSPGETFDLGGKVVVVIVGSDFTDATTWQNQVPTTFSDFYLFPFFGDDSEYVAFYVNELHDSFCELGCYNIDRLLCCTESVAKSIALSCYDNVASVQILAIHNTDTYGGSGGEIATVTTNSYSSLVGVHEVGHSLFGLQDEYDWDYSGRDDGPNCDLTPGCPRWSDLLTVYPDLCTYKGCGGGNYFISEQNSFMLTLNTNVGPVLRRLTCCTFYALTSNAPEYCDEFLNAGDGLINFCTNNGYSPAGSVSAGSVSTGMQVDHATITTPTGSFVYVVRPMKFIVDISSLGSSAKSGYVTVTAADIQGWTSSGSGYYASAQVYGDFNDAKDAVDGSSDGYIQAEILFESGNVETRFYASFTTLFAPPPFLDEGTSVTVFEKVAGVKALKVPKSSIEIMVEKNLYDPINQVTVKHVDI